MGSINPTIICLYIYFRYRVLWNDGTNVPDEKLDSILQDNNRIKEEYNRINWISDSLLSNSDGRSKFLEIKDSLYKDYSIFSNRSYRDNCTFDLDSLDDKYQLFVSLHDFFALPEKSITPLYYYNFQMSVRKKWYNDYIRLKRYFVESDSHWKKNFTQDSINNHLVDNISLQRDEYKKNEICQEGFSVARESSISINDPYAIAIGDPGWFALEDISQSYYRFEIRSKTIDTIRLEINFVGSTVFSQIVPEPDDITMNTIVYHDSEKIEQIKQHGLFFHVKFVELENRQTIRLFFLTAIMSGLFTIFIGFLVLASYKTLFRRKTENKDYSIITGQNEKGRPNLSEN